MPASTSDAGGTTSSCAPLCPRARKLGAQPSVRDLSEISRSANHTYPPVALVKQVLDGQASAPRSSTDTEQKSDWFAARSRRQRDSLRTLSCRTRSPIVPDGESTDQNSPRTLCCIEDQQLRALLAVGIPAHYFRQAERSHTFIYIVLRTNHETVEKNWRYPSQSRQWSDRPARSCQASHSGQPRAWCRMAVSHAWVRFGLQQPNPESSETFDICSLKKLQPARTDDSLTAMWPYEPSHFL